MDLSVCYMVQNCIHFKWSMYHNLYKSIGLKLSTCVLCKKDVGRRLSCLDFLLHEYRFKVTYFIFKKYLILRRIAVQYRIFFYYGLNFLKQSAVSLLGAYRVEYETLPSLVLT